MNIIDLEKERHKRLFSQLRDGMWVIDDLDDYGEYHAPLSSNTLTDCEDYSLELNESEKLQDTLFTSELEGPEKIRHRIEQLKAAIIKEEDARLEKIWQAQEPRQSVYRNCLTASQFQHELGDTTPDCA